MITIRTVQWLSSSEVKVITSTRNVYSLPMDSISSTTVRGSVPLQIYGNATVVKGVRRNAISLHAGRAVLNATLDNSTEETCIHDTQFCDAGLTAAFWINPGDVSQFTQANTLTLVSNNGGFMLKSPKRGKGLFKASIANGSNSHVHRLYLPSHWWTHLTFVYSQGNTEAWYVNGVPITNAPIDQKNAISSTSLAFGYIKGTEETTDVAIDDFIFYENTLSHTDILNKVYFIRHHFLLPQESREPSETTQRCQPRGNATYINSPVGHGVQLNHTDWLDCGDKIWSCVGSMVFCIRGFTVSFWFMVDADDDCAQRTVMTNIDTSSLETTRGFDLTYLPYNHSLQLTVVTKMGSIFTASLAVSTGEWQLIQISADEYGATLYAGSNSQGTSLDGSTYSTTSDNNTRLFIGKFNGTAESSSVSLSLSNLIFVEKALNQQELEAFDNLVGSKVYLPMDSIGTNDTSVVHGSLDTVTTMAECSATLVNGVVGSALWIHAFGQYGCTFEDGLCFWTQDTSDIFDWTRSRGPTSTSKTGPSSDHTLGTDQGWYLYIEASIQQRDDIARVLSPDIPAGTWCLQFWYHMYSGVIPAMGTLNVYLKEGENLGTAVWTVTGNQGDQWNQAQISIANSDTFKVVFEGIRGTGYKGDIAMDDITVSAGDCPECYFPFTYDWQTYMSCTDADNESNPWCSTAADYAWDDWRDCDANDLIQHAPGAECIFPFTYRGGTYYKCISVDAELPWCGLRSALSDNPELGVERRYCNNETDCFARTDLTDVNADFSQAFSLVFWMRFTSPLLGVYLDSGAASNRSCGITLQAASQTTVEFLVRSDGNVWKSSSEVHPDQWTHLAFCWSQDGTLETFINGMKRNSTSWVAEATGNSSNCFSELAYGKTLDRKRPSMFSIDEIRFHDRELTAGEIKILYAVGTPVRQYNFTMESTSDDGIPDNQETAFLQSTNGSKLDHGLVGNALVVDEQNSYFAGPFPGQCLGSPIYCINGFTVSIWVKSAGIFNVNETLHLLSTGGEDGTPGFSVTYESLLSYGQYTISVQANYTDEQSTTVRLAPDVWSNIQFSWSNQLKLYVNGVPSNAPVLQTLKSVNSVGYHDTILYIGRKGRNDNASDSARLLLDNFFFTEKVLQQSEVLELYESYSRHKTYRLSMQALEDGLVDGVASVNGTASLTSGVVGNAIKVDTTSGYLHEGDFPHDCMGSSIYCAVGFTLAVWMKVDRGTPTIISNSGDLNTTRGFALKYDSSTKEGVAELSDSKELFSIRFPVMGNRWMHVALVWESGTSVFSLYLNSRLVVNAPERTPLGYLRNDPYSGLYIGRDNSHQNPGGNFSLDEVLFQEDILSQEDIQLLYGGKPKYMGCYQTGPTDIISRSAITHPDMSVDMCLSHCVDGGQEFAAVGKGTDCYCGSTEYFSTPGSSTLNFSCNVSCPGNNDEICGGETALSVYRVNQGRISRKYAIHMTSFQETSSTIDGNPSCDIVGDASLETGGYLNYVHLTPGSFLNCGTFSMECLADLTCFQGMTMGLRFMYEGATDLRILAVAHSDGQAVLQLSCDQGTATCTWDIGEYSINFTAPPATWTFAQLRVTEAYELQAYLDMEKVKSMDTSMTPKLHLNITDLRAPTLYLGPRASGLNNATGSVSFSGWWFEEPDLTDSPVAAADPLWGMYMTTSIDILTLCWTRGTER
ncbi:uncharacterized protein LOC144924164 [Branchiostoma floridae x Branchiostoma belcheri]